MSNWQTIQISEETAHYELSHLNLHCLQNPLIAFGNEMVNVDAEYGTIEMCHIFCVDAFYCRFILCG